MIEAHIEDLAAGLIFGMLTAMADAALGRTWHPQDDGRVLRKVAAIAAIHARRPVFPARAALRAALVARNAAAEGDDAGVDEFARIRLGLSRPSRWREAVKEALLGDWTPALGSGPTTDTRLTDLLKRHTRSANPHHQPLWERKIHHRRVALLSEPIGAGQVVADLLVDHRSPELDALYTELADSRLGPILRGLTADERARRRGRPGRRG
ncbi:hypothetical protein [Kitasatospora sp. DSM 101779]|uniref:hypothetical protein n=1 Tax=Kitasatospora sp. DSM 101779 TaxID=2853165 RepID=UPI0021DA405A|nr:hypothetical protein [Kitasatospora sp. DSM 101779]MCU7820153.1 hypothetical protein [Kitasatospora sp. DSM 101779]